MSIKNNSDQIMQKITDLYIFLTKKEPTPDDEIESREELIALFSNLKNLNKNPANTSIISEILSELQEWDTLELWFLETSLPNKMALLLNIPNQLEEVSKEVLEEKELKEEREIDLTDVFNKVSEQFQGEIEGLKGKIEDLKKELEVKDEKLKSITEKKKIQKIAPKKEIKLPPPKIKIPVIKKTSPTLHTSLQVVPPKSTPTSEKIPKPPLSTPIADIPQKKETKVQLSPIPLKPEKKPSEMEKEKLIPIPKAKPQIEPIVIEEPPDIPIITEKKNVTPNVAEKQLKEPENEKIKLSPFNIEKPKISSVSIEEIEEESIKSSSSNLFNVFSSIGSKSSEKSEQKIESEEQIVEDIKSKVQSKKAEIANTPENENKYVIFNEEVSKSQIKANTSTQDNITSDKDSLYQELIALEGKRYALEKVDKDLKERYSKGSLADLEFKNQSINLEKQLEDITTRIHNIRRLISSL